MSEAKSSAGEAGGASVSGACVDCGDRHGSPLCVAASDGEYALVSHFHERDVSSWTVADGFDTISDARTRASEMAAEDAGSR